MAQARLANRCAMPADRSRIGCAPRRSSARSVNLRPIWRAGRKILTRIRPSWPESVGSVMNYAPRVRGWLARLGLRRTQGSYFVNQLVPIRRNLPRDPALVVSMRALDQAVGAANLRVAEPPPPAEPGRAHFSGAASCVRCHKAAARFCKATAHAHAWRTLQTVGKTAHDDCVSCHVTGYGEVGGSSVGFSKGLQNVQCEACHGPGSIHVEKRGLEKPLAVQTRTPDSVCTRCHNEKHSDTFQYEAYLRDIIGPGHGEDARDKLGDGPTAKVLRRAAAKRARSLHRR